MKHIERIITSEGGNIADERPNVMGNGFSGGVSPDWDV